MASAICTGDAALQSDIDMQRRARCRKLIRQRRHLARQLEQTSRDRPILDMLLDLYLSELEGRDVCQSGIATRASRASAHRHVTLLVERGLVVRHVDPADQRRRIVKLTASTRRALDHCIDTLPDP